MVNSKGLDVGDRGLLQSTNPTLASRGGRNRVQPQFGSSATSRRFELGTFETKVYTHSLNILVSRNL